MNELHKTQKGVLWQCDLTDRIYLQFGEVLVSFRVQDFFNFRRKVDNVDIHEMIFNLSDDYDFELIEAPRSNFSQRFTFC